MNSFYVPALAGQIYAMAGMQTRLQLLADAPGKFVGRNTQYSGGGFSDQHLRGAARRRRPISTPGWRKARQSPDKLDAADLRARWPSKSRHSPDRPTIPAVEPKLFDSIIDKYTHAHSGDGMAPQPPRRPGDRAMFGKLTIEALPLYSAIAAGGALVTVGGALLVAIVITWLKALDVSVDRVADQRRPQAHRHHVHRAGADHAAARLRRRLMMRAQQAMALNNGGYLPPEHFDQIFSSHGTIMIFFMAMPFLTGLMNIVVPLQIGTRDVAFPFLNSRQPVADRVRRRPGHGLAGDRQVLDRRLDRLSALFGHRSTIPASASTTGSGRS